MRGLTPHWVPAFAGMTKWDGYRSAHAPGKLLDRFLRLA
ncbi:hypothetical protein J2X38_003824 [Sphingopyxis sp. BE235]|nr:hypothetical protein [Sphingopyxis sp. BE235]MDR7182308.1 hypothetical protein [Sphingopyxis sp. BE249]